MPHDPSLPADATQASAAQMRAQLQRLKALIDAIGAIVAAQIDGVTTLNPGDPASASVAFTGDTLHFTFAIPRGNDGAQGNQGDPGGPGPAGPQGPPFAQAIVDAVNTLAPGSNATLSVIFDGPNVRFTFGIPAGANGADGAPGEVSNQQLNDAIGGTSNNTNAVATLDSPFADADTEAIRQKLNELILAARR